MADLGGSFGSGDDHFISAIDELRARDQWVGWKLITRTVGAKPTKPPVNPHNGMPASHSKPSTWGSHKQAKMAVDRYGLAGVGYVLSEDDDYTGVDLDKCRDKETGTLDDWAQAIIDKAETYCEVSPSGTGVRMIARGKIAKAIKNDLAHVEIYGSQRYLTITGDHIHGTPLDIREAPNTIATLATRAEAMRPKKGGDESEGNHPKPLTLPRVQGGDAAKGNHPTDERLRAWKAATFGGIDSDFAGITDGGRNTHLNDVAAYRYGRYAAGGFITKAEAWERCKDGCARNGLLKEDGADQCRKTFEGGFAAGWLKPHEGPGEKEISPEEEEADRIGDQIAAGLLARGALRQTIVQDGVTIDAETGEILEGEEIEQPRTKLIEEVVDEFPEHLTCVPGLMGEIVEWVYGTSARPSRTIALSVAIGVIGTISGRAFCGPSYSGTHSYIAVLGITGGGKGHTHNATRRLLEITKLFNCIGPSRFTSQNALENHVKEAAVSICLIDEIGDAVRKFHGKNAASVQEGMADTLMSLWNINMGTFMTTRYAAHKGTPIKAPSLSILGLSTEEKFWAAFEGADISSGFLNRFLILRLPKKRIRKIKPPLGDVNVCDVPQSIIDGIESIRGNGCPTYDFENLIAGGNNTFETTALVYASGVNEMTEEHEERLFAEIDKHPERDPFYARTVEMAIRLATIRAIGRGSNVVDHGDMSWGQEVADWSAKDMMRGAKLYMSENDFDKRKNQALRLIMKKGGCDRQYLAACMKGVKPRELDEVVQSLIDGNYIVELKKITGRKDGKGARVGRFFSPGRNAD